MLSNVPVEIKKKKRKIETYDLSFLLVKVTLAIMDHKIS